MLYNGDCIEILKTLNANSVDLIFADPPYFLSNGGKSIHISNERWINLADEKLYQSKASGKNKITM